jgi:alkylation response protein AidB-like acyl-CoA dehydrogenase
VDFTEDPDHRLLREAVREACARFPDEYWAELDESHTFPWEFYEAMAKGGWIGIAIPAEYGGAGGGITEASIVLEEVAASGACMNGASSIHRTPACPRLAIRQASWRIDQGLPAGEQANLARFLAAEAGFAAADAAMQTHGGFGYAREYHVERYWREARLMRIAPVPQEMVLNYLAEHVLGLPRSY